MEKRGRVLVTGATGFAGTNIVPMLIAADWQVRACGRELRRAPRDCEFITIDLAQEPNLDDLVTGSDAVLHLAGRAHVMRESAGDPLAEYRCTNVVPTKRLLDAAARNGVRQFIFASSVKVHGESSQHRPIRETDPLNAEDPYGVSKVEAEHIIVENSARTGMSTSILRLPLMYGPGVKGNILRLAKLVRLGVPLPFASINNQRSMLNVDNLGSAILALLNRPMAGHRTFLVSDGHDVSTPELLQSMAEALGQQSRLFPFPPAFLRLAARATGRGAEFRRLSESLQIDIGCIREQLGWKPPFSLGEGISKTLNAMVLPIQQSKTL